MSTENSSMSQVERVTHSIPPTKFQFLTSLPLHFQIPFLYFDKTLFFCCIFSSPLIQGWEFAYLISEQIACFFYQKWANECFAQKNERFIHSLIFSKRIAHGRSFLVSEMSDLLTSLIWFEQNEQFTHIAHQKRGNERK